MNTETCRLCALFAEHEEPGVAMAALISSVEPSDSIPLCSGHWNRWLAVFMPLHAHDARPPAPCGARLITITPKETDRA